MGNHQHQDDEESPPRSIEASIEILEKNEYWNSDLRRDLFNNHLFHHISTFYWFKPCQGKQQIFVQLFSFFFLLFTIYG